MKRPGSVFLSARMIAAPPEPVDLPTCCSPSPGEWKHFRIEPAYNEPFAYRVKARAGWFDYWGLYANAGSLESAFAMIPQKHWKRTRVIAPQVCTLHHHPESPMTRPGGEQGGDRP